MSKLRQITVRTRTQWRRWLQDNHISEERVFLISYKKHTGEKSIPHRAQVEEAVCFGWIDTTVKRIDESRYGRTFVKRKPGANWSKNTLQYAKKMLAAGKMSAFGRKIYQDGLKRNPIDHDVPDTFDVPDDLKQALSRNKKAKRTFDSYPPSVRRMHLKWLFSAKREATRQKRIQRIVDAAAEGGRVW
jgi:uncharacterized protein YdeI (YjbR/CyaY-like superfamily)